MFVYKEIRIKDGKALWTKIIFFNLKLIRVSSIITLT